MREHPWFVEEEHEWQRGGPHDQGEAPHWEGWAQRLVVHADRPNTEDGRPKAVQGEACIAGTCDRRDRQHAHQSHRKLNQEAEPAEVALGKKRRGEERRGKRRNE